ncbi:MAG: hypothetical protein H0T44_00230 [Gemmatimonadales bacterium]|nr:hypothetical protein [Gemmatimonadales bacterium]
MKLRHLTQRRLLVSLMLLPTIGYGPSTGTSLDVAGSIALTASITPALGKDAAGRAAFIGKSKGTNQSTGAAEFMNGAEIVTADTANLVDGTGPHQGSITMSKGADKVVYAWKGQVTTKLAADKKPNSTFEGTWNTLNGSGAYAGVSGRGTYQGRFSSATASVIEWEGTITR